MKELNLDEVKDIQLEILDAVADFCCKNDISYSLSFGTLLGAVRHKGYIPWDDDIDIMMLRKDYEFFIKNFNYWGKIFQVKNLKNDKLFPLSFSKVEKLGTRMVECEFTGIDYNIGINIDIFPLDKIPTGAFKFSIYFLIVRFFHKALIVKSIKIDIKKNFAVKSVVLSFLKLALLCLPYNILVKMLNIFIFNNFYKNSKKVMVSSFPSVKKSHVFPENFFNEYIDMNFEGRSFKVIKEFNSYLTTQYGNFMKLPPTKQRVSHHKFKAYLLK